MNERPIIITKALIPPTLAGDKKVTRRLNGLEVFNVNPDEWTFTGMGDPDEKTGRALAYFHKPGWTVTAVCPYGDIGHTLWVRENFGSAEVASNVKPRLWPLDVSTWYEADDQPKTGRTWPCIFMPHIRSRIDLEITNITVERLHAITEDQAKLEGVQRGIFRDGPNTMKGEFQLETMYKGSPTGNFLDGFKFTWMQLNGRQSWDLNPHVWVISFNLLKTTA